MSLDLRLANALQNPRVAVAYGAIPLAPTIGQYDLAEDASEAQDFSIASPTDLDESVALVSGSQYAHTISGRFTAVGSSRVYGTLTFAGLAADEHAVLVANAGTWQMTVSAGATLS